MNPDDFCEVCITAPDPAWLGEFTRALVTDRLCACGHITSQIRSIYRWDRTVHDQSEARVALHTRRTLIPRITQAAKTSHPYELPGIFVLPIIDGNPDYLQWIHDETTGL